MSGDQARVSVTVRVPVERAFELFTEDIDRWWRRGPKYRHLGRVQGIMRIEPRVEGRVFEAHEGPAGRTAFEIGQVTVWEPPSRFAFTWRNVTFAAGEVTTVEVEFSPVEAGTVVRVTHRGWSSLRDDHPARHGHTGTAFSRMIGLWWGEQLSALREAVY